MQKRTKPPPKNAEDAVVMLARQTTGARLANVARFLPLAALHAEDDVEYVHQLRVSTRRALACLAIYEEALPKKEAKWFRKQLRCVRQAAGEARDLDVFLNRYSTHSKRKDRRLVRQLLQRRKKVQQPILKLYKKLTLKGQFQTRADCLLTSTKVTSSAAEVAIELWAPVRMRSVADNFFGSIPQDLTDPRQLHCFRVRTKELRYAVEILADALPSESCDEITRLVRKLQDKLGEINDHAVAQVRLESWADRTHGRRRSKRLRKLAAREKTLLKRSIKRFGRWWTPEFEESLKMSVGTITAPAARREADVRDHRCR